MKFRIPGLMALSTLAVLAACASQPGGRAAPNELSTKAAGYYKYRLSLQRENVLYEQYAYLRIEAQDGKDRISLCKDTNLGTISFFPEYQYVPTGKREDLGEQHTYRTLLPRSSRIELSDQDEDWDGVVQIDTLTLRDGTMSLFVITARANRYLARTPARPISATEFAAECAPAASPKQP